MKILFISHAMVVDVYREKFIYLADNGRNEVVLLTPKKWKEAGQIVTMKPSDNKLYQSTATLRLFKFHGATFLYGPKVFKIIRNLKPDIIHVEEEPFSLAILEILILKSVLHRTSKVIFFTWQNIYKNYLPPFNLIEQYVLKRVDGAIAGNHEAVKILKGKGFAKPIAVIPQIGIEPKSSMQKETAWFGKNKFTIGFIGRLEKEKGIATLLSAVTDLRIDYELWIIGNGSYIKELNKIAAQSEDYKKLKIIQGVAHHEIPRFLDKLDVLILPSRTTPKWKEQFGRILIEAMACGIPVIGSSSGAIPEVIGDAGLVFDEDSPEELANHLVKIFEDVELRKTLTERGRERVLKNYAASVIAEKTLKFYKNL